MMRCGYGATARMPDVLLLLKALAIGAPVAAAVLWIFDRGTARLGRLSSLGGTADWSWAVGAGVIVASGVTDAWPHWPPLEDRARFLTLIVPLTLLVESVAAVAQSRKVAWGLRCALAAAVAPILLYKTVYLADLRGENSAEWSNAEAILTLGGLATLLAIVWTTMSALQARTSARTVPWLLAFDAAATSAVVMMSGYFRAGVLGLGLAGAIFGATIAALFVQRPRAIAGSIGMGVIGIFSVVVMGRYFGALTTSLAMCLLLAPLVAWAVEAPWLRRISPGRRGAARFACVLVPLLLAMLVAERQFRAASAARTKVNPALVAPNGPAND